MAFDYHHHHGPIDLSARSTPRVSPERRRQVVIQERDRRKVEVIGERVSNRIAPEINAKLLRSFERGENIVPVLRDQLDKHFLPLVHEAMVTAHLYGRLRSARATAAVLRKRPGLSAYDDALQWLQTRLALTPEQADALMQQYGNEAAKVTRELGAATEQAVQRAVQRIIESGAHVREGVAVLREELQKGGAGPLSASLMNTLVRTQTQMAYSAGRWNANQHPAIQEILWGYEYCTVGDYRVRPAHMALDGLRLPKDDPKWGQINPPNGFNCRCSTIEIFIEDREASATKFPEPFRDETGKWVVPGADEGWAFNPGKLFAEAVT